MIDDVITNRMISDQKSLPENPSFTQRVKFTVSNIIVTAQSRKFSLLWIGLVIISCLSWSAWNIINFKTSLQINTVAIHDQFMLESEIDKLTSRWDNTSLKEIDTKLKKMESKIFSHYKSLAEWLYLLTENSKTDGIILTYKLGMETEMTSLPDLISIPIEIEALVENKTDVYDLYFKLLDFMESLITEPWHQELQQASIENAGKSKVKLSLTTAISMLKPKSFISQTSDSLDDPALTIP